ncbi:methionyl-tRNA formyltransferase [Gephyromycinifex aptenodytis]|uniref:methionyl-tRNA formyltransferase n=1 Tax=Gephyromycinifex aptenodytis TaxID=2716227 RepID=UPI001447E353|nr:methionyl-tRNA formyltransferase [Gephyromycinifex aptenodytis]
MRLVFAGTPEVALPSLQALLDSSHEVVAVLTRPDARVGRGRSLRPSPVKEAALAAGIEVLTPQRVSDPEFLAQLAQLSPHACPVVAYGNLVPPAALAIPAHGWLNLHFSLLPAWRGAAPVQHAIIAGESHTGACVFQLEQGLDTGPVLGELRTPIGERESAGELLDRLAREGAALLLQGLEAIAAGTAQFVPQAQSGISHAPKITVADAEVDWAATSGRIDALVRGCTPAPGAWTTFRGQRLKLYPLTPLPGQAPGGDPGRITADKRTVQVSTGDGLVRLGLVQPQGKKPMDAADWARGVRVEGERFSR